MPVRPPFHRAACVPTLFAAALLGACGGGGGGSGDTAAPDEPRTNLTLSLPARGLTPSDLALIVATGDAHSEAVAAYYQSARGVPAANVIRVDVPVRSDTITSALFATLKGEIDAKLPAGVQATLLTWRAPSRVVGATCAMGITSAVAFGYDAKYCNASCNSTSPSPYFDTESSRPQAELGMRPSMMLGANTVDGAKALIDRGIAADNSQPPGEGWLIRSSDAQRNVRGPDYTGLPGLWAGRLALNYVDSSGTATDSLSGRSNVLFYFTGLAAVPNLASNSYRPGAAGDSLTSYAGRLGDPQGQTLATAWLDAGLTGSYGTVQEPCSFTQKFPQASVLIDQYWRGATLIEAYWKSVAWPGEGLFVGEPLARPFRDTPSFTLDGNDYLISSRALRRGARYALEYRTTATGSWITQATFTIASTPQVQSLRTLRPPATAVQIRWMGPCPGSNGQQCVLANS